MGGLLLLAAICAGGAVFASGRRTFPELGPLPPVPVPADNPMNPAKAALGRRLFFDRRLSRTGTMSCATCHNPARGYADGRARTRNPKGKELGRNAMTILNAAYAKSFFWDGREPTLEKQALEPFLNPEEMGLHKDELVSRVAGDPAYARSFQEVFGMAGVSVKTICQAIAAFERTLVSSDTPFDRYSGRDRRTLSKEAVAGLALFKGKAQCIVCHHGAYFSDGKFHNIGVPRAGPWKRDPGRQRIDGREASRRAFKTPTLRNAALTAPYMHNGAFETLADVLDFYGRGGDVLQGLDPDIHPLGLTPKEKGDLLAFLESLTDPPPAHREAYGAR